MSWIRLGVVPQQLELVSDEGPNNGGHVAELVWEIPEVLYGLEQHSDPVAIHLPTAGVDEGVLPGA